MVRMAGTKPRFLVFLSILLVASLSLPGSLCLSSSPALGLATVASNSTSGASSSGVGDEVEAVGMRIEQGMSRGLAEIVSFALGAGNEGTNVVAICLFVFLLSCCMVVAHLLEEVKWLNESVTAVVFGLITGAVVLYATNSKSAHILHFDEDLFFFYLLPPIIFNAGFQVKKKQFFRNFGGIMLYGVVGVFMSVAVIAAGCQIAEPSLTTQMYLVWGVIFSATDSVCTLQVLDQDEQPLLYSLVFGEGVVNDATSVVLFYAMSNLTPGAGVAQSIPKILLDFLRLFTLSTALGVAFGLLSAFLIKTLYFGRHSTDREIALMVLMAYQSYVTAELFSLSGILAVFFCGIVMSHYTWHNVTESSRVTTKHAFAIMSYVAETFIFIYVGMDALDIAKWGSGVDINLTARLFAVLMVLILLGRAAFVFPLSWLMNQYRKSRHHISIRQQVVIWWAGLMRGAVSIALVYRASSNFETTISKSLVTSLELATMGVVLFSLLVFGSMTRFIIDFLVPHNDLDRCTSLLTDRGSTPMYSTSSLETPFLSGKPTDDAPPPDTWPKEVGVNGDEGTEDGGNVAPGSNVVEVSFRGYLEPGGQGAQPEIEQHKGPAQEAAMALPKAPGRLVNILTSGRERDLHDWWRWFDDSYMHPYFGGRGFLPKLPTSPTGSIGGEALDGQLTIQRVTVKPGPPTVEKGPEETDVETMSLQWKEETKPSCARKLESEGEAIEGSHLCDEPAWPEVRKHATSS